MGRARAVDGASSGDGGGGRGGRAVSAEGTRRRWAGGERDRVAGNGDRWWRYRDVEVEVEPEVMVAGSSDSSSIR